MPINWKNRIPDTLWNTLLWCKTRMDWSIQYTARLAGLLVTRTGDYYSPLPAVDTLRKNQQRWDCPSDLQGIHIDLNAMKTLLLNDLAVYWSEFMCLPAYDELQKMGFGPGYNAVDGLILYALVRQLKPKRYFEVGSGLSTVYCHQAVDKNRSEGHNTQMVCIEPYPYKKLKQLSSVEIIVEEVQALSLSFFEQLESGDILFIDSSHVLKIDGDVAYLYLKILPHLKPGVIIHIHDIPFPYNTPFPADHWIFSRGWPKFWTEAMLLQSFLSFNTCFQILLSLPLLRYYDEGFLQSTLPFYETIAQNPNTFSSIWIRRFC
jgi:hypothetical protein